MKNRGLFFLGVGLVVLALVLAIITGLITPDMLESGRGTAATSAPPEIGGGQTARQASEQVLAWAETESIQAEIISVSATLRRGEPASSWTFQLYQRSDKQLIVVRVETETVQVLREQQALYAQHPFSTNSWSIDSNAVLDAWWAQNGQSTWNQPTAQNLNLHLGQDRSGTLAWTVTVLDQKSEVLDVFRMHAETGAVIPLTKGQP